MKRPLEPHQDVLSANSFKNPVCQETFDSLPRIYGTIKTKILNNKMRFYDQLQKRSIPKLEKSREKSASSNQNRTSLKKRSRKKTEVPQTSQEANGGEGDIEPKAKQKKPTADFSDKFHKFRQNKKNQKVETAKSIKVDDHETKHKVRNHTLNFLLPTIGSTQGKKAKPETLSDLIDDKISKSVSSGSPLVHLYKNKSPMHYNSQIKEENNEDESPNGTIVNKYMPKEIRRSLRQQKEPLTTERERATKKERTKTEPSEKQTKTSKFTGIMTEFSKRIARESEIKGSNNHHGFQQQGTKFRIPTKEEYKAFIEQYRPINAGFSLKALLKKQNFQIIAYQNGVYFGQFNTSKDGLGVLITQDLIFEGYFSDDVKIKGAEATYDGTYFGSFNTDGLRSGRGKFQWNNGQIYEGSWHEGKKHGKGIWKSPSGDQYEGEWVKGRQQGKGQHKHNSSTYKGEFMNSLKHGHGLQIFANGDTFKGMYENGKPHGHGRYEWSDGSYYQGQFHHGYREGKGVLHEKNGTLYKGSFRRDFKHGFGQEFQKTGEKFEGQFEDGYRVYQQFHKR